MHSWIGHRLWSPEVRPSNVLFYINGDHQAGASMWFGWHCSRHVASSTASDQSLGTGPVLHEPRLTNTSAASFRDFHPVASWRRCFQHLAAPSFLHSSHHLHIKAAISHYCAGGGCARHPSRTRHEGFHLLTSPKPHFQRATRVGQFRRTCRRDSLFDSTTADMGECLVPCAGRRSHRDLECEGETLGSRDTHRG